MPRVCLSHLSCYKAGVSQLRGRASVAIIGGGFAGAATAWALRRAGVTDVVVLEREPAVGRFASGRSAGIGRSLAEDHDTTAFTARGAQLLRELSGIWAPTGGVMSFDTSALFDAYAERASLHGVAVEPAEVGLVGTRWPQLAELRAARALWIPGDGVIDVTGLLELLLDGIDVQLAAGVERVEPGPRLVTSRGPIDARVVVDAAGAWAGELTGGEPLSSYKRHVFVMAADAPASSPWLWHVGAGELYLRSDASGVLASPCDAAPSQPGHQDPDLVGEEHLRRLLDDAASPLAAAPITRRWACQRAFTADRRMRLGRDPARPWLVWAAGLGGHGVTAAPAVGEAVAAAVIEALR
jgi:D-arginine dehydrogenase